MSSWVPYYHVGQGAAPSPAAPPVAQVWPLFLMTGLVIVGGLLLLRGVRVI